MEWRSARTPRSGFSLSDGTSDFLLSGMSPINRSATLSATSFVNSSHDFPDAAIDSANSATFGVGLVVVF